MELIASFTAKDGSEDEVRDLLSAYASVVRAQEGTVLFEPSTAVEQPNEFVVFERYRDESAFRAHVATVENAAFNQRLAPLIRSDVALRFLQPLETP
jgi:quinol monooxygenase YgiN